jgi:hypothetical protein
MPLYPLTAIGAGETINKNGFVFSLALFIFFLFCPSLALSFSYSVLRLLYALDMGEAAGVRLGVHRSLLFIFRSFIEYKASAFDHFSFSVALALCSCSVLLLCALAPCPCSSLRVWAGQPA